MTPSEDQTRRALVGQWLHKAQLDLEAAEELLSSKRNLHYPACFHCQQAAEKCLKGYLTWFQIEFPKTHSIRELLNLARAINGDLVERVKEASSLTTYGVEVRYPGDLPEPTRQEAETALALARSVRDEILRALPLG